MTTQEFSNEFDTLINSYSHINNLGNSYSPLVFNEYEKSVFLTKAQEDIVRELYSGKNVFRDTLEKTEETKAYLNPLIKVLSVPFSSSGPYNIEVDNIWYILYEEVELNGLPALVVPTQLDDYYKTMNNPFKRPNSRRVLRIDTENSNYTRSITLVPKSGSVITKYILYYIAGPLPIILEDLPDDLNINGLNTQSECELNTALHRTILDRAVKLALQSRFIGASNDNNNNN